VQFIWIICRCIHITERMPLTAAERQKRFRDRHKEKCRELDAKRKREASAANVAKARESERARQRRCRAKGKNTVSPVPTSRSPAYKNSSSIGKAVKRAREALPKSPRKHKAVIRWLAVGNEPTRHEVDTESKYAPEHKVPADVSDAVKKFYEQPDISWMSPGKKDLVIIKTGKRKDKVQKSFLMMTIREA